MKKNAWITWAVLGGCCLFAMHHPAFAQKSNLSDWVGTWAAAPMTPLDDDQQVFCNVTLREIVHVSLGGDRIRVRFTNEFGTAPLAIAEAHVALSAGGNAIQAGTDHPLTFQGNMSIRIPAGAIMLSDPVQLNLPPLSNVAVSIYLPCQYIRNATFHDEANQTNFMAAGNGTASLNLSGATEVDSWYFLDGFDVQRSDLKAGAIIVLGDSITDGAYSGINTNRRWTDFLAERLQKNKATSDLSVLNEGIGGNRILNDRYGPNALSRFDRDVLSQSGVKFLVILEGTNDIGHLVKPPVAEITAHELETAFTQIVDRAHAAGIVIYGATIMPFAGAGYYSPKGEKIREAVNQWIRTSGVFDAVIDLDRKMQDPQKPTQYLHQYDHGDHLHPNAAGYKAMSDAVDLKLFQ